MQPTDKNNTSKPLSDAPSPAPLIQGEDYYMEGGFMVFTEQYHLKRGYCCKNGCRHCPFRKKKAQ